jgi:uncharacterized repeat protein (TIGR04076 family)
MTFELAGNDDSKITPDSKEIKMRKDLEISVKEIKGTCPVYKKSDSFFIRKGYILESKNQNICMHALSSLMPFYGSLSLESITPSHLGLGEEEKAYIQCPDPCQYTKGGTVLFEIRKI